MELPNDLWSTILQKTKSIKNCEKLYDALPLKTREELKNTYESHKKSLDFKFFCAFPNKLCIFNNDIIENEIKIENIIAIQYVKDWNTILGRKDCIVIATKEGLIHFLDAITLKSIEIFNTASKISEIVFHPRNSIFMIVERKLFGRKMIVWKFDLHRNSFTVIIEFLGDGKKLFYFHPTEPEIYIFICNYSSYPYQYKLSKIYFCNYNNQSINFSSNIHSYLYIDNFYTPLKLKKNGSFDCLKFHNNNIFLSNFKIDNYQINEIKLQPIFQNYLLYNNIISNFFKINENIYLITNHENIFQIYKIYKNFYKIIYTTNQKISNIFKIIHNKNLFIFVENNNLNFFDIQKNELYNLKLIDIPIDLSFI